MSQSIDQSESTVVWEDKDLRIVLTSDGEPVLEQRPDDDASGDRRWEPVEGATVQLEVRGAGG